VRKQSKSAGGFPVGKVEASGEGVAFRILKAEFFEGHRCETRIGEKRNGKSGRKSRAEEAPQIPVPEAL
jgi:hypothetical protein